VHFLYPNPGRLAGIVVFQTFSFWFLQEIPGIMIPAAADQFVGCTKIAIMYGDCTKNEIVYGLFFIMAEKGSDFS